MLNSLLKRIKAFFPKKDMPWFDLWKCQKCGSINFRRELKCGECGADTDYIPKELRKR